MAGKCTISGINSEFINLLNSQIFNGDIDNKDSLDVWLNNLINVRFTPEQINLIKSIIYKKAFGDKFDDFDDIDGEEEINERTRFDLNDFIIEASVETETSIINNKTENDVNQSHDATNQPKVIKITNEDVITLNYNGDSHLIDELYKIFTSKMVEMCIFNKNDFKNKVTPLHAPSNLTSKFKNNLNQNIYEFKVKLLNELITALGYSEDELYKIDYQHPEKIENKIIIILNKFEANKTSLKDKLKDPNKENSALHAFTILKNFDKLILQVAPFIEIRPGLLNNERLITNKYVYVGGNTKLDKSWKTDESVDINDQLSSITGILLDYFPEYTTPETIEDFNNKKYEVVNLTSSISKNGFFQVISAFKYWLRNSDLSQFGVLAESTLSFENLLDEMWNQGEYEAFLKLLRIFYEGCINNTISHDNFSMNKLTSIIIMLEHPTLDDSIKNAFYNLIIKTEKHISHTTSAFRGVIKNKVLQDSISDQAMYQITKMIVSGIRRYKYMLPDVEWNKIKDDNNQIIINENKNIIFFAGTSYECTLTKSTNFGTNSLFHISWAHKERLNSKTIAELNSKVINLLFKLANVDIPVDYQKSLSIIFANNNTQYNLMNLFGNVLGYIVSGIEDINLNAEDDIIDARLNSDPQTRQKYEQYNIGKYKYAFNDLQKFLAFEYGADVGSTLKNAEGNIVSAYTLTTPIYQTDRICINAKKVHKEKNKEKKNRLDELKLIIEKHNSIKTNIPIPTIKHDRVVKNAFQGNPCYDKYRELVLGPDIRLDVDVNGIKKSSSKLTESEAEYVSIMSDFWSSFIDGQYILLQNTEFSDKNTHFAIRYNLDTRFNDKTLRQYISNVLNSKLNSHEEYQQLIFNSRRTSYLNIFYNLFSDFEEVYQYAIAHNDDSKYLPIIEKELNIIRTDIDINSTENGLLNISRYSIQALKDIFINIDKSELERLFNNAGIDFIEELHYTKNKTKFNETLFHEFYMYIESNHLYEIINDIFEIPSYKFEYGKFLEMLDDENTDPLVINDQATILNNLIKNHIKEHKISIESFYEMINKKDYGVFKDEIFKAYDIITTGTSINYHELFFANKSNFIEKINKERKNFLHDLEDCKLKINYIINKLGVSKLINYIGEQWIDKITGDVKLSIPDLNNPGNVIINPLLDAYYYSDLFLSNNFNQLALGNTWFHPNKYKENSKKGDRDEYNQLTDLYYQRSEASRLLGSLKRTVHQGSTVHTMMPMKYGISRKIKIACIEDLQAAVYNMMGEDTKVDAWDGSGISSIFQAMLENLSLLDAKVGLDKKTIWSDTDPVYGTPRLLKWAVDALTNDRRQMSIGSEISGELLFKKMHDIDLGDDKFKIKLNTYYKGTFNGRNVVNKTIARSHVEQGILYRYDINEDKYYVISNMGNSGNIANWTEYECDSHGVLLNEENPVPIERQKEFNTIYDLDQIFGGAYAMELNKETNTLEYSDINNRIVLNMICDKDWKDKFVGYAVQKSGLKVGATNLNKSTVLSRDNDDKLKTFDMSLLFGGVLMDADHILADSEVTEMSQMISALIQNGYFTNDVNKIYEEIGQIVIESLGEDLKALLNNDYNQLHSRLGKDLIKDFSSGAKDTIGLAQSFIMKALKQIQEAKITGEIKDIDIRIPFSDPTVNGAFIANLVSNINKHGIKRRYAGIAAILIQSRGLIQYYNINGKKYMYNDLVKWFKNNSEYQNKIKENKLENYKVLDFIAQRGVYAPGPNDIFGFMLENSDHELVPHPFIKHINRFDIDSQQTILVVNPNQLDENGQPTIEQIKINSFEDYDSLRNDIKYKECQFFQWTIKPSDLRQSDTTFKIDGQNEFSIYQFDSVRAAHYLNQLLDSDGNLDMNAIYKNNDVEKIKKIKTIEKTIGELLPTTGKYSEVFIKALRNKILKEQNKDLWLLEKQNTIKDHDMLLGRISYTRDILQKANNIYFYNNLKYIKPIKRIVENDQIIINGPTIIGDSNSKYFNAPIASGANENSAFLLKNYLDTYANKTLWQLKTMKINIPLSYYIAANYNGIEDLDQIIADCYNFGEKLDPEDPSNTLGLQILDEVLWLINGTGTKILLEQNEVEKRVADIWNILIHNHPESMHIKVTQVTTRPAEIVMGRMDVEKFGLRPNDSISKIKDESFNFFKNRLKEHLPKKLTQNQNNIHKYFDHVAYGSMGKKLYVKLRSNIQDKNDFFSELHRNISYEERDGNIYLNDYEICKKINKEFYTYYDKDNNPYDIVIIDDISELDDIITSDVFADYTTHFSIKTENAYDDDVYNTNKNILFNVFESLLRREKYIDENGYLIQDWSIKAKKHIIEFKATYDDQGMPILHINDLFENLCNNSIFINNIHDVPDLLTIAIALNNYEEKQLNYRIENIAKNQYKAFMLQLQCIGARIPTQSMQSFQYLKVVGFTNSKLNEVYVPACQTWLQGSDYDIDKLYIMRFHVNSNGIIRTFSNLQYANNPNSLKFSLALDLPTGIKYREHSPYEDLKTTEDSLIYAVNYLYDAIPELSRIGTKEDYIKYLKSIYPESQIRDIYWHGSNSDFSNGLKTAQRGQESGAPETKAQNHVYFNKQPWTSLQYIDGVNRDSTDVNGFKIWNKLWWQMKELLGNGRMETDEWKHEIIGENTRRYHPNKYGEYDRDEGGEHGKTLEMIKANYGYEDKTDEEFFTEVFDIKYNLETFDEWVTRKEQEFKNIFDNRTFGNTGLYPAIINVQNPYIESGQNTYYEEQRQIFTKAKEKDNDTVLSNDAKNEFGSDVLIVLDVDPQSNNRIHWLGSQDDLAKFKEFVAQTNDYEESISISDTYFNPYKYDISEGENYIAELWKKAESWGGIKSIKPFKVSTDGKKIPYDPYKYTMTVTFKNGKVIYITPNHHASFTDDFKELNKIYSGKISDTLTALNYAIKDYFNRHIKTISKYDWIQTTSNSGDLTEGPIKIELKKKTSNYTGNLLYGASDWISVLNKHGINIGKTALTLSPTETKNAEILLDKIQSVLPKANIDHKILYELTKADSVFAISKIIAPGEMTSDNKSNTNSKSIVNGKSGILVEGGIILGKPIFVYDTNNKQWFTWDYREHSFKPINIPTLTKNFIGVSSENSSEINKIIIEQVIEKTFNNENWDLNQASKNHNIPYIKVSLDDVINTLNFTDPSVINKISRSKVASIVFDKNITWKLRARFINMLNRHSSTHLSRWNKEDALKNITVGKIIDLLEHPINQISGHKPISTDALRSLANKSKLSDKETRVTTNNPHYKYLMQVQAMVGKDVIGITAVGMKVFFAATNYVNNKVLELAEALKNKKWSEANKLLSQITFDTYAQHRRVQLDKAFNENNSDNLIELAISLTDYLDLTLDESIRLDSLITKLQSSNTITNLKNLYNFAISLTDRLPKDSHSVLANTNLIPILEVINELDKDPNNKKELQEFKNWYDIVSKNSNKIDAAEAISQLLSAATDNAKELILAKINATSDFADAWSYLISSGWTLQEIAEFMMSPGFDIVSKFSKPDIFSGIITGGNPDNAIKFVLGLEHLFGIDTSLLKYIIGRYRPRFKSYDNECFLDKLIYKTYDEDVKNDKGEIIHYKGEIIIEGPEGKEVPVLLEKPILNPDDDLYKQLNTKDSDARKNILLWIFGDFSSAENEHDVNMILSDATEKINILLKHLEYLIHKNKYSTVQKLNKRGNRGEGDIEGLEEEYAEEDRGENYNPEGLDEHEGDWEGDDQQDEESLRQSKTSSLDFSINWQNSHKISGEEIINIYRYIKDYIKPKMDAIEYLKDYGKLSAITDLNYFNKYINPGIKEQKIIGTCLSVNQGLSTNEYEFYKKLKQIQNFINRSYLEYRNKLEQQNAASEHRKPKTISMKDIEEFDILRFIQDENYEQKWIKICDNFKVRGNVLDILVHATNFKEMFKLNALAFNKMTHSINVRMDFLVERMLLGKNARTLSEQEWLCVHNYNRDLILYTWLFNSKIKFKIPTYYSDEGDLKNYPHWARREESKEWYLDNFKIINDPENPSTDNEMILDSPANCATFVHIFESYIFHYLKNNAKYKNNEFVKDLTFNQRHIKSEQQNTDHVQLATNIMNADKSVKTKAKYDSILAGFNKIANDIIPDFGMTIQDALFIYNTIVYKNGFTQSGFTKLMETVNLRNNNSLINSYSKFVADLDHFDIYETGALNKIDISWLLDPDELKDKKDLFNFGILKGSLRDIYYRLSFLPTSESKFNIKRIIENNIKFLIFEDAYGNEIKKVQTTEKKFNITNPNANDWTLDMPIYNFIDHVEGPIIKDPAYKINLNSQHAIQIIVDHMLEVLNLKDKNIIKWYNKDYLDSQRTDPNPELNISSAAEYNRLAGANAFIHNGRIYLNEDSYSMNSTTVIHEMMHLICANAKFNNNPEIRTAYYKLLHDVISFVQKEDPQLYAYFKESYPMAKGSDFKEEVLVNLLSTRFTAAFNYNYNSKQIPNGQEVDTFIINTLDDLLQTTTPQEIPRDQIGRRAIENFLVEFKSKLINVDGNSDLLGSISLSAKIKTIKRKLIEGREDGKKNVNYVIYDC